VICAGAEPIGVVDHLQFGSPEDPEIFWTFSQAINAIIDYCNFMQVPVVGGKVSFYNETARGPIKPSPVMGTLGLIKSEKWITRQGLGPGDRIFVIGETKPEIGGSEYYEYVHKITGGPVPAVDMEKDRANGDAVMKLIRAGHVSCVHDCSKGGLAVALAEMAVAGKTGFKVKLDLAPSSCTRLDELMFSESHSRYVVGTKEPEQVAQQLKSEGVQFAQIGRSARSGIAEFAHGRRRVSLSLSRMEAALGSLEKIMQ
jgi:phosphoribosylformylglycinamidine synthase